MSAKLAKAAGAGSVLLFQTLPWRCQLLLKDDEMLWRFMENDEIALTNNEAERALRGYVLWRKGSYGVWSHRGEQFRQRILSLVETAKRLGRCPQEWLRAVVRSCIEKTDHPFPEELVLSTPALGMSEPRCERGGMAPDLFCSTTCWMPHRSLPVTAIPPPGRARRLP